MYCIKCGVKLADTEKQCPLCGTVPFHPELAREEAQPLYPQDRYPVYQVNHRSALVVISTLFLIPLLITLLCDLRISERVTWSGFVMGALVVAYVILVLPFWFHKPNPVVFVPCDFGIVALYLLYISIATGGNWFLPFAFPVVGFLGITVTAVVTLLRYVRQGVLYIFGGAGIALGAFMPVMEFLLNDTFGIQEYSAWAIYPMVALVLLGGMLIFLAISRPARETMERKFFI